MITCYVFLAVCILFDVTFEPIGWLYVLPALIVSGLMLGALWLFLSVYIRQVENFAGAMNFVMFPMFFFSSALYPLWKLREGGSELIYWVSLANPFTHAVEMIRFALYGMFEPVARAGRRRLDGAVLSAGRARLRSAARHVPPHGPAGVRPRPALSSSAQAGDPIRMELGQARFRGHDGYRCA